eukprot:3923508-Prorocentrum_lima.AAC.1
MPVHGPSMGVGQGSFHGQGVHHWWLRFPEAVDDDIKGHHAQFFRAAARLLSLIHISEPTRLDVI